MIRKTLFPILGTVLLCSVTSCRQDGLIDRSLVFSTHTTMGLELSVSPAETSGPVNMVLGYKRTEGVINPVYHSDGIETPHQVTHAAGQDGAATVTTTGRRPRYREESYSVIAKFAGETGGKADQVASAGMSVAQWFATGEAAKTIASQPGIAGAVSGSSDIADAAAQEALSAGRDSRGKLIAFTLLSPIYEELRRRARDENDSQARALADKLDTIKPDGMQCDFPRYTYWKGDLQDTETWPLMPSDPFLQFHACCTRLGETMKHLKKAVTDQQLAKYNGAAVGDLTKERARLYDELDKLKDRKLAWEQVVRNNRDIIRAAVDHLYR